MKVHFIGDLGGNREDYKKIAHYIEKFDNELVTDHFLTRSMADLEKESEQEAELYAKKMVNWMKKADVVVVEITKPLLGSGYEIAFAIQLGKPVVALYRPEKNNTPYVLKGLLSEKLQVVSYDENTLEEALKEALDYANEQMDTRFNFFVSPSITNYLDWISKKRRVPRAVYLRRLIENDMNENEEYSGSEE